MDTATSVTPFIVLNDEQVRVIANSAQPIEVRDSQGRVVSHIDPISTSAAVQRALQNRASNQPRYSSEQVQARLAALKVAAERDGLNREELFHLFLRLQGGAQ